MIGEMLSNK